MPTPYTNCSECFEDPSIYNADTEICNSANPNPYKIHLEIEKIIIKKSINLKQCEYCSTILCKEHQARAHKWAKYYQNVDGLRCNNCCWRWVT
jgi:hypothetical protein